MPYYAAMSSYTKLDPKTGQQVPDPDAFHNSFPFFLIFMTILCFVYLLCAYRTNIILCYLLVSFIFALPLLASSYWYQAAGYHDLSTHCRIAAGAIIFAAEMAIWWLFTSMLFDSVDFPVRLPIGNLSERFLTRSERKERKVAHAV